LSLYNLNVPHGTISPKSANYGAFLSVLACSTRHIYHLVTDKYTYTEYRNRHVEDIDSI